MNAPPSSTVPTAPAASPKPSTASPKNLPSPEASAQQPPKTPAPASPGPPTIEPFAMNYRLIAPMSRLLASLSLRGKVHGVAEDPAEPHQQTLSLGRWQAAISYGRPLFGNWDPPKGNPEPSGGALLAELGPDEFLVTGFHSRVDFSPANRSRGEKMQFARVEEGAYENGEWKFIRVWNGDQTDWGLNFTSVPQVLRVRLATY